MQYIWLEEGENKETDTDYIVGVIDTEVFLAEPKHNFRIGDHGNTIFK